MLAALHRISIRDLIWLTLAVGLWFGWAADRDRAYKQHEMQTYREIIDLRAEVEKLRDENSRFKLRE